MEDIDLDINMERAINIIMNNIAELTKKFSVTKDEKESNELKDKINILNKIKDEIYFGNENIIKKVIEKNYKGMI